MHQIKGEDGTMLKLKVRRAAAGARPRRLRELLALLLAARRLLRVRV